MFGEFLKQKIVHTRVDNPLYLVPNTQTSRSPFVTQTWTFSEENNCRDAHELSAEISSPQNPEQKLKQLIKGYIWQKYFEELKLNVIDRVYSFLFLNKNAKNIYHTHQNDTTGWIGIFKHIEISIQNKRYVTSKRVNINLNSVYTLWNRRCRDLLSWWCYTEGGCYGDVLTVGCSPGTCDWCSCFSLDGRVFKAELRVEVDVCLKSCCCLFLHCPSSHLHTSSSKPMPTLCPPALKFLASIRADRVSFTPAERNIQITSIIHNFWLKVEWTLREALVTWPQALCVTNSNQTGVVYFGLRRHRRNLKCVG